MVNIWVTSFIIFANNLLIYLTKIAFSFEDKNQISGKQEINNQLKKLGKFSNEEFKVAVIFGMTALAGYLESNL